MKHLLVVTLLLLSVHAGADTTSRTTNPTDMTSTSDFSKWQVSGELGGAGLLYSVFGSYRFTDMLAANVGLSYWSISASSVTTTASASAFLLPTSLSLLLGNEKHNLEIKAGGVFNLSSGVTVGTSNTDKFMTTFIPNFGIGYRRWPKVGGFHFRAMLEAFIASSSFIPWGGVSFGYAF